MTIAVQVGLPATESGSYSYDNPRYLQSEAYDFTLAATAAASAKFTAFTKKQLRSVTAVPTVIPTVGADQWTLTLVSLAAQAFGTATGGNYAGNAAGTNTATGSNTVTIPNFLQFGTAPIANPNVAVFGTLGGTYTVVVANGVGTNTQAGYVFPSGPTGGLALNPGDILTIAKGTDTVATYVGEAEVYFTPGTNFTV
jgi:hypothetical protein